LAQCERKPIGYKKTAARGCGRVSNEAFDFDENTMFHWTSQSALVFLFHSLDGGHSLYGPRRIGWRR
jgi:hypothetical protein